MRLIWRLASDTVDAWLADDGASMGAALAYYALFSLAPLLVITIALAGLVFGPDAARSAVVGQFGSLMGDGGAAGVRALLESASQPKTSVIASIAGILTMIVGATSTFSELQDDLDRIWRVKPVKGMSGLLLLIRARIVSFQMVMVAGFLLLVSLIVSTGLEALSRWSGPLFGDWRAAFRAIDVLTSFVTITVMFALIYKILPRVRVAWRDVWVGAVITALLFTAGKFAIGYYLGHSGVSSAFGAAGSIVVLIAWIYYSAQIFFLGAEFTCVWAHRVGSRREGSERARGKLNAVFVEPATHGPESEEVVSRRG